MVRTSDSSCDDIHTHKLHDCNSLDSLSSSCTSRKASVSLSSGHSNVTCCLCFTSPVGGQEIEKMSRLPWLFGGILILPEVGFTLDTSGGRANESQMEMRNTFSLSLSVLEREDAHTVTLTHSDITRTCERGGEAKAFESQVAMGKHHTK